MKLKIFIWLLVHLLIIASILIFRNQFSLNKSYLILSIILMIFSILTLVFALGALGRYYTPSEVPKGLVTNGIYSKIRHPIYFSIEILLIGLSLFFTSLIGLILTIVILVPLHRYRIKREEGLLFKRFGKKYLEYRRNTWF